MTCIVGLVDNGKVYIGGDSAGVSSLDITTRKDPKVFKTGEMVFGYTSSFRMGQILRFLLHPIATLKVWMNMSICVLFLLML